MPDWSGIQPKIDRGRGKAAGVLGPPFDVYRLSASGDFISDANRIAQGVRMYYRVETSRDVYGALEANKLQEIVIYDLIADLSQFKLGDIFVCKDPIYGESHTKTIGTKRLNAFAHASHGPIKKVIGARINTEIRVKRQRSEPDEEGNWSPTSDNANSLKIVNGVCKFGIPEQKPSLIPVGLVAARGSYGDRQFNDVPAMSRKSSWVMYVPNLPGFHFREGDRIETRDGAKYVVIVAYEEETGFCGSQLFIEREIAQPG